MDVAQWRKMMFAIIPVAVLTACGSYAGNIQSNGGESPNTPRPVEAALQGEVVDVLGKIQNRSVINRFLESVQQGRKDHVRITNYTDEGDPIITLLDTDGKTLKVTYDNSRDRFGGMDRGIVTTTCSGIVSHTTSDSSIAYELTGCADPKVPSIVLIVSSVKSQPDP